MMVITGDMEQTNGT